MFVADISEDQANGVMQATNWGGSAVVGTWEREVAEHIGKGMTQAGRHVETKACVAGQRGQHGRLAEAGRSSG